MSTLQFPLNDIPKKIKLYKSLQKFAWRSKFSQKYCENKLFAQMPRRTHAEYRFPHNPHNYTTDILLPLGFFCYKNTI